MKVVLEFLTQPAQSPDLNVLDLGAWFSIQAVVEEIKYERETETYVPARFVRRIITAVMNAWKTWLASEKLELLFLELASNVRKVLRANGGNDYDGHSGVRKQLKRLLEKRGDIEPWRYEVFEYSELEQYEPYFKIMQFLDCETI